MSRVLILALLLPALLTGCDGDRLNQFGMFAAAGSAYVTAFHGLVAETGDAMVASDSATLIVARRMAGDGVSADRSEYRKQIVTNDKLLQQYLVDLEHIDQHARLLGEYFDAVTALTNGKAQQSTSSSADGLLDAISALNPQVESAKIGTTGVKDFLHPATTLVVAHFQVNALTRELQRAAPVIDQALALQEAAVAAMSEQLQGSLQSSLEVREATNVITPYVASGPLPPGWAQNRENYVRTSVAIGSAGAAKRTVAALHQAFRALVANRATQVDLRSLLASVGTMTAYTTTVHTLQADAAKSN